MTQVDGSSGTPPRPRQRPWLPWFILATSLILVSYSVDSFLRLPQQLRISQQCRMSYMRPAYVDHTANLEGFSPSGLWRKYRLYLYRERDFEPMDLPTGSPALFVPGNSGSYGQVRSVASSAARQFYKEGGSGDRRDEWKDAPAAITHTDWYTLDFNEDFSAFSGSSLIEQATFINEVISYLTDRYAALATHQYAAGERKTTVPILAHSMGGIAARLTRYLPNYHQGSIDTIVTLSTPHAYPPVPFDRSMEHVYSLINQPVVPPVKAATPWSPSASQATNIPPLLVSVAGGLLDTQLPSDPSSLSLARIAESVPASRISTFTNSLPSLWSSIDHLAVMWCDQLREKIARGFLLEMMAFGRIADERNAGGVTGKASMLRRRRELWRRALSLFDTSDAGNGEIGPKELLPSSVSPYDDDFDVFVMPNESPSFDRPSSGPESALSTDNSSWVYRMPSNLGDGDDDLHAFELITNLCIGWNPSSGMGIPIQQPVEIVVQTCTNVQDSRNPISGQKTSCQLVMPWQWELIPSSLLPRTDILTDGAAKYMDANLPANRPFPSGEDVYHVPGFAFQRLRLDANFLKRNRVDWIRVERKTASGMFVHQRGLNSFIRAGWMHRADGRTEKHGSSLLLTGGNDRAPQQTHQDPANTSQEFSLSAVEWILKGYGSSLLARRIQVTLSQCVLDNLASYTLLTDDKPQGSKEAAFSPFLHVSNRATGDSRWYPQLATPELIRKIRNKSYKGEPITFPLSLHGNAPFMPPARASVDEVRLQVWADQALLRGASGREACTSPVDTIRSSIDYKASAGLILLRYRFFLAAWPLGLLAVSIGLSWLAWATSPYRIAFPSPLSSIMRPPFQTPFIGKRIDPLLGLLACLTGTIIFVDSVRLVLYKAIPSAQSHGPSSSLLGMVLGLSEHSSTMSLVPCFLAVAYATLFIIVAVTQGAFSTVAVVAAKFGISHKLDWVGAATASSDPLRWNVRSMVSLTLLLLSVVLFVPHQFVFLCIFLLQMLNTLRAQLELRTASKTIAARSQETRYHQHLSIFLLLLLLLPQKASFLVTWVRNLGSVGLRTPKTAAAWMDHNVFDVAPIVVLVWIMAGGRMLEPPRSKFEARAIALGFGAVGWYALVWGIRYTYSIYDAFNILCVLLAFCHWRSRRGGSKGHLPHRATKDSEETYEMLREEIQGGNGDSSGHRDMARRSAQLGAHELQSGSDQLPVHHLALPASVSTNLSSPSVTVEKAVTSFDDELDKTIAEYLEVLDQYQRARTATAELFSSGYFKLSRAKMEYGPSRLSSNSYDSRLLPEIKATIFDGKADLSIEVQRIKPDYSRLSDESAGEERIGEANVAEGLRKRIGLKMKATREEARTADSSPGSGAKVGDRDPKELDFKKNDDRSDDHSSVRRKPKPALPNALLQFGGLPSTSLRGAQTDLKLALDQALGVRGDGWVQLVRRLDELSKAITELKAGWV